MNTAVPHPEVKMIPQEEDYAHAGFLDTGVRPARKPKFRRTSSLREFTFETAAEFGKAQTESLPGRKTVIIVAKHFAEKP